VLSPKLVLLWYGFLKYLVLHWSHIGSVVVITQHLRRRRWRAEGDKACAIAGLLRWTARTAATASGAGAARGMGVLDQRQHHRGERIL
jgi:hypothetical protein